MRMVMTMAVFPLSSMYLHYTVIHIPQFYCGILRGSAIDENTNYQNSQNPNSQQLVVYDADTKNFELVHVDDLNNRATTSDSSSKSRHGSQSDDSTFVCVSCGHINHGFPGKTYNNKNKQEEYHSGFQTSKTTDEYPFQSRHSFFDTSEAPMDLRSTRPGDSSVPISENAQEGYSKGTSSNRRFDRRQLNSFKKVLENGLNKGYTMTSSGDLLSHDYFKLLASTVTGFKDSSQTIKMLKDDIGSSDQEDDNNESDQDIPTNLINQGYFDKFFKIINKLGSGSFGTVYKVEHELLGLNLGVFALKKIPIGNNRDNLIKILNEVKFLYNLSYLSDSACADGNSSHVVKYNHAWLELSRINDFGPEIPIVFLLFEYCDGGTLEDWVESVVNTKIDIKQKILMRRFKKKSSNTKTAKPRMLTNFEIFRIFSDISQGLKYLHDLKIIHRDLKPSNCLFKTKFDDTSNEPITSMTDISRIPMLLVSDFGESIMEDTKRTNVINRTGATGTIEFCAPELLVVQEATGEFNQFNYSSDIYSLGMILYYLCFGKLPYATSSPTDIRKEILGGGLFEGLLTLKQTANDNLAMEWLHLIEVMVNVDPNQRPTIDSVLLFLADMRVELSKHDIELSKIPENDNESDVESELESDESYYNNDENDSINVSYKDKLIRNVSDYSGVDAHSLMIYVTFVINQILLHDINKKDVNVWFNVQFLILGIALGTSSKYFKKVICILQLISCFVVILTYALLFFTTNEVS